MVLQSEGLYFTVNWNLFSVWPNFHAYPNTLKGVKYFPDYLYHWNKCSLTHFFELWVMETEKKNHVHKKWVMGDGNHYKKNMSWNLNPLYILSSQNFLSIGMFSLSKNFFENEFFYYLINIVSCNTPHIMWT